MEEQLEEKKEEPKPTRPVCKFFARTGKCRHGAKCRFEHTRPESATSAAQPEPKKPSGPPKPPPPRQPIQKKPNLFARGSMLGDVS